MWAVKKILLDFPVNSQVSFAATSGPLSRPEFWLSRKQPSSTPHFCLWNSMELPTFSRLRQGLGSELCKRQRPAGGGRVVRRIRRIRRLAFGVKVWVQGHLQCPEASIKIQCVYLCLFMFIYVFFVRSFYHISPSRTSIEFIPLGCPNLGCYVNLPSKYWMFEWSYHQFNSVDFAQCLQHLDLATEHPHAECESLPLPPNWGYLNQQTWEKVGNAMIHCLLQLGWTSVVVFLKGLDCTVIIVPHFGSIQSGLPYPKNRAASHGDVNQKWFLQQDSPYADMILIWYWYDTDMILIWYWYVLCIHWFPIYWSL